MPATWKAYGTDANRDGRKDPFNPVDAIFAAARYLRAAGADDDLRRAIFAYNHADWYVESVLMRARLIGGLPTDLVGSLSGLTQGHFPVFAKARYADDLAERDATRRVAARQQRRDARRGPGDAPRHRHLRRGGLAGDRRAGRHDRRDRQVQAPGQLRPPARRLRQHLHVRASQEGRPPRAGAEDEDAEQGVDRQGARAAQARPEADAPRLRRQADHHDAPLPRRLRPRAPRPARCRERRRRRHEGAPVRPPGAPQRASQRRLDADPRRRVHARGGRDPQVLLHGRSTASTPRTSCSSR